MSHNVKSPVQLYKFLLRNIKKLPKTAQGHYKHHVKQQFKSHSDEIAEDRIKEIIEQSIKDCQWVINKYSKKSG
ncbi:hypothetical protein DPMN_001445 [Dreissena polymorpha]|uniref:LYR motif-containing protein 9 n=1 Tax=Dreissena polymorpha TaxID=45954 RepID=A0A9D4MK23_DREPO|nr:hypothetical protein DPMN_001445 [Dreissena polymorpha]